MANRVNRLCTGLQERPRAWQGRPMGWDEELFALFDDLEGQATALYDAQRAPELADRGRAEYQHVALDGRLMASVGLEVTLELVGVGAVTGRLARVSSGWCLVRGHGQDWVVPHAAVAAVHGASDRAVPAVAWPPVAKLGLASALRRPSRNGQARCPALFDGRRHDGPISRGCQVLV